MTREKLDREAEELFKKKPLGYEMRLELEIYTDGFSDGYNKANEWHYVKNGDLPEEDTAEKETLYLLYFGADDSDYITGVLSQGRFWCFDCGWFDINEVVAWKEIVLPELLKERLNK